MQTNNNQTQQAILTAVAPYQPHAAAQGTNGGQR